MRISGFRRGEFTLNGSDYESNLSYHGTCGPNRTFSSMGASTVSEDDLQPMHADSRHTQAPTP
jgi:hypothetical protein